MIHFLPLAINEEVLHPPPYLPNSYSDMSKLKTSRPQSSKTGLGVVMALSRSNGIESFSSLLNTKNQVQGKPVSTIINFNFNFWVSFFLLVAAKVLLQSHQ